MSALLLLLVALAAAPGTPAPEEGGGLEDLEGLLDTAVVTGASQAAERALDAPATVTIVTREELERLGVRTLAEAINFLSVGMLTQDPLHSVEIGARGVLLTGDYGNHVLLAVDGHVLNEPWDGTAYFEAGAAIPLQLVDHLELLVGPGSVTWGSSAMLGVIHVVTRRAADLRHVELSATGGALPALDVAGTPTLNGAPGLAGKVTALAGGEWTVAGAPLEVVLALEYFRHRGSQLTFGLQQDLTQTFGASTVPADYGPRVAPGTWGGTTTDSWWTQVPTAVLKAKWGDFWLWGRAAVSSRSTPYFGAFGVAFASNFDAQNVETDRFGNFELGWSRDVSSRVRLQARLGLDLYDYDGHTHGSMWAGYGSGEPLPVGVDPLSVRFQQHQLGYSQRALGEVQAHVDWTGDGRFPFLATFGLHPHHLGADTTFFTETGLPLGHAGAYDVTEWQGALALQQRAKLGDFLLNAGVRFDRAEGFGALRSPRVAVTWRAPWNASIKALVSTAFRAPTGFERFTVYPGYQLPHPDLKPEQLLTGELTYEQRLGRHRVLLNVFSSRLSGLIAFEPAPANLAPNGESWFTNVGVIDSHGASVQATGTVGALYYGGAFTLAYVRPTDHALAASPTWFGNARVGWVGAGARPTLQASAFLTGPRLVDRAFATTPTDQGEVGWAGGTQVGPHTELRLTASGPLPWRGVSWRGVVGGALDTFGPYVAGPTHAPEPWRGATSPALAPVNDRLFLDLGLAWALDAPPPPP